MFGKQRSVAKIRTLSWQAHESIQTSRSPRPDATAKQRVTAANRSLEQIADAAGNTGSPARGDQGEPNRLHILSTRNQRITLNRLMAAAAT